MASVFWQPPCQACDLFKQGGQGWSDKKKWKSKTQVHLIYVCKDPVKSSQVIMAVSATLPSWWSSQGMLRPRGSPSRHHRRRRHEIERERSKIESWKFMVEPRQRGWWTIRMWSWQEMEETALLDLCSSQEEEGWNWWRGRWDWISTEASKVRREEGGKWWDVTQLSDTNGAQVSKPILTMFERFWNVHPSHTF